MMVFDFKIVYIFMNLLFGFFFVFIVFVNKLMFVEYNLLCVEFFF